MTEEINCALRPMNCEINLLSRSDGSTLFMQGNTAIVAGVNGPVEAKTQKMLYDRAYLGVTYTSLRSSKMDDRLSEVLIQEICEFAVMTTLHPSTMVYINIQEMEDSGGLFACAINAVCLALMNSGISMKFTFAAVSCVIEAETGNIIIDPRSTESQNARATFTFAFDSIKKDILSCNSVGQFTKTEFSSCVDKCRQASQYIFDYYREMVKKCINII